MFKVNAKRHSKIKREKSPNFGKRQAKNATKFIVENSKRRQKKKSRHKKKRTQQEQELAILTVKKDTSPAKQMQKI